MLGSLGTFLAAVAAFGVGAACCYYFVNAQKKLDKYPEDKKKQVLLSVSTGIGLALLATGTWIGYKFPWNGRSCRDSGRASQISYDDPEELNHKDPAETLYDNAALRLKQGDAKLAVDLAEELILALKERRKLHPEEPAEPLKRALRLLAQARRALGDRKGAARAEAEFKRMDAQEKTALQHH